MGKVKDFFVCEDYKVDYFGHTINYRGVPEVLMDRQSNESYMAFYYGEFFRLESVVSDFEQLDDRMEGDKYSINYKGTKLKGNREGLDALFELVEKDVVNGETHVYCCADESDPSCIGVFDWRDFVMFLGIDSTKKELI
jgi:hypothetical protein